MAKRFGIFPCHEKKAIMDRRILGDRDNYKWLLMITFYGIVPVFMEN